MEKTTLCPANFTPNYRFKLLDDDTCINPISNFSLFVNCTSFGGYLCTDDFCEDCTYFLFEDQVCQDVSDITSQITSLLVQCNAWSMNSLISAYSTLFFFFCFFITSY